MSREVRVERAVRALAMRHSAEGSLRRALAEAHEAGATWRELGEATGLAPSTCYRLARLARPLGWRTVHVERVL